MGPRELLEFRTPQHPNFGTNNWGGTSPLLARNIPNEALDQRYLRLNTKRDHDDLFVAPTIQEEIFGSPPPSTIGDEIFSFAKDGQSKHEYRRKWHIRKLIWQPRKRSSLLGSTSSSRWFPRLKMKKRWPQGWC